MQVAAQTEQDEDLLPPIAVSGTGGPKPKKCKSPPKQSKVKICCRPLLYPEQEDQSQRNASHRPNRARWRYVAAHCCIRSRRTNAMEVSKSLLNFQSWHAYEVDWTARQNEVLPSCFLCSKCIASMILVESLLQSGLSLEKYEEKNRSFPIL